MAVDASPRDGRVLIASSGGPLTAEPSWSRYDNLSDCKCFGFDWERGRSDEFDVTKTGSARVFFHDRSGTFDSGYVGNQIMLQLWNPVAGTWEPCFRGHIDTIDFGPAPDRPELTNVELRCNDIFDYLANCKMVVGLFGDAGGPTGRVFYEDERVDERMDHYALDAGLASSMVVHFTGNVNLNEKVADPDDDILSAYMNAADAEFPGVGNVYPDRYGRVVFHGRFAKFDPDTTSSGAEWNFTRWEAGTREDVPGRAAIREFAYSIPRDRIINSYLAWPERDENGLLFDQELLATMTQTNSTSISSYGMRGRNAPALEIKDNFNNSNTGAQECELFAEYYVTNYSDPRINIDRCVFKSIRPWDARADETWALMTGMDISDVIHMFVDEAGLTDEQFFIEGISGQCRVGPSSYDFLTVTPNLSPAAYYADNVFE